ncbi:hypothetical protein L1787_05815 [Acuticoccus sp. M5D2P5]|uniref:glycosyltransferase n=1 Tax=Acuticoccus kalidii TaxID=2910977 RepID=UPI001F39AC0B|nr:glycosyltransferase [Acuticoccus kalidii]MCF3932930.1 hypothetical protein [Acuticoccus kalidii]
MSPIPLVQFWDRRTLPPDVAPLVATWTDGEDGLAYRLWSDVEAERFLARHYGRRARDAYRMAAPAAMRSDLFRYAVLHRHGGVYVDCDVGKAAPLAPVLAAVRRGIIITGRSKIENDFMFVRAAGDPLMAHLLEAAIANVEARASNNVWAATGPGIATFLWREVGGDDPLFAGYDFVDEVDSTAYLIRGHAPAYKETDAHWLVHQKARSIYQRALPIRLRHRIADAKAAVRRLRGAASG